MVSIFGKTVCRDINEHYKFVSMDKFTNKGIPSDTLVDWETLPNNQVLIKTKDLKIQESGSSFPSILGIYILAYSRAIMNSFVDAIDGWRHPKIFYTDTDSLYMREEDAEILNKCGMVGEELGQVKSETAPHYIKQAIFLGPKQKFLVLSDGSTKISFKGIDFKSQESLTLDNFLYLAKRQENKNILSEKDEGLKTNIQRFQRSFKNGITLGNITKKINGDKYIDKMNITNKTLNGNTYSSFTPIKIHTDTI